MFTAFPVGTVLNAFNGNKSDIAHQYSNITIQFPSRINAMALDPSLIEERLDNTYSAGEIIITTALFKSITVSKIDDISDQVITTRPSLVLHAIELMRCALDVKQQFKITINDPNNFKHSGLGSSSSLIAGVMCAINELYGSPITARDLVAYAARNHGEETKDEKLLSPVQCLGGSAVAGLYEGCLSILVGKNRVLYSSNLPQQDIIIGIPSDYKPLNADELMVLESQAMPNFVATGLKYRENIAYQLTHHVIPELMEDNSDALKDLIYNYRFNYGSIVNCSFCYPRIIDIAEQLRPLYYSKDVSVLGLSSVGPAFFAVSTDTELVKTTFEKQGLKCIFTKVYNGKFKIDQLS
jgi:predicted sugar kinase